MIYLFLSLLEAGYLLETTRLSDAALRRDCRAYEGIKKSKFEDHHGNKRKSSEDRSGNDFDLAVAE